MHIYIYITSFAHSLSSLKSCPYTPSCTLSNSWPLFLLIIEHIYIYIYAAQSVCYLYMCFQCWVFGFRETVGQFAWGNFLRKPFSSVLSIFVYSFLFVDKVPWLYPCLCQNVSWYYPFQLMFRQPYWWNFLYTVWNF